jgi:hypothetical protein
MLLQMTSVSLQPVPSLDTIGDTENWADVSFSCQNF